MAQHYDSSKHMSIMDARRLAEKHGYVVKDVSGARSFGYDYAIYKAEEVFEPVQYVRAIGEPLAESITVEHPGRKNMAGGVGAYSTVFDRAAVEAIIAS